MSTVDNSRPPYVMWEIRQVEDRAASVEAGRYVAKDVDFAVITRPGSRDTQDEVAETWLKKIEERSRKGEIPANWHAAFKESYEFWKKGQEAPISGTPIKGWGVLSPAAQKDLLHAGIRTVEDLAEFSDSELSAIGIGALSYKQKAKAFLLAAKDVGQAAEKIAAQQKQIEELSELVRKLGVELETFRPAAATKKG